MRFKSKVFIVSGLPPGSGGVGRLMRRLVEQAKSLDNCEVIYRRASRSLNELLSKKVWFFGRRINSQNFWPYLLFSPYLKYPEVKSNIFTSANSRV